MIAGNMRLLPDKAAVTVESLIQRGAFCLTEVIACAPGRRALYRFNGLTHALCHRAESAGVFAEPLSRIDSPDLGSVDAVIVLIPTKNHFTF